LDSERLPYGTSSTWFFFVAGKEEATTSKLHGLAQSNTAISAGLIQRDGSSFAIHHVVGGPRVVAVKR
jgi:hypothetical protein